MSVLQLRLGVDNVVDGGGVHGECSWCVWKPLTCPGSGDRLVLAQVFKGKEEQKVEKRGKERAIKQRGQVSEVKCACPTGT